MKTLILTGIITIVALALTITLIQFGSRIRLPRWMGRRQPLRLQFTPLHNKQATIMLVDEGVRIVPFPYPRTDGTIFDQMVAEYGFNPLAS